MQTFRFNKRELRLFAIVGLAHLILVSFSFYQELSSENGISIENGILFSLLFGGIPLIIFLYLKKRRKKFALTLEEGVLSSFYLKNKILKINVDKIELIHKHTSSHVVFFLKRPPQISKFNLLHYYNRKKIWISSPVKLRVNRGRNFIYF